MSALSPPVRRLLAVTILVLLVLGAYAGIVAPLQQQFADYDATIEESARLLERFRRETLDPAALERQRRNLESARRGADGLLKGDNEAIAGAFVQHFVTTAVEAEGGTLRSIQVLPVKAESGFRRVTTRAQINVTTPALRDLLHRIEASRPFLFIDSLDVRLGRQRRARGNDAPEEEVQLLVRMDVYGFLAPEKPPALPPGQGS